MRHNKKVIKDKYLLKQFEFHKLIDNVPEGLWLQSLPNSNWTVSHNLWHVTLVLSVFVHAVRGMRKGRNYPMNLPAIRDLISTLIAYKIPSKREKLIVKKNFDNHLDEFIVLLDELEDDEWDIPGRLAGEDHTIFEIYNGLPDHIDEHMLRVQEILE